MREVESNPMEDSWRDQTRKYCRAVALEHPEKDLAYTPWPTIVKEKEAQIDSLKSELWAARQTIKELKDKIGILEAGALPSQPGKAYEIARCVAASHGMTFREMLSKHRSPKLVKARHHAMWEISERTNLSLSAIGRIFALDHTTIIHGIRMHQKRLDAGGGQNGGLGERSHHQF